MADSVKWNGGQAKAKASQGVSQGLEAAAAQVLAKSQAVVPFIKGDLSRSGKSGMVNDKTAAVTYTERGAIDAHERMDITPANGRQRKFLESSLSSGKGETGSILQRAVKRALDG